MNLQETFKLNMRLLAEALERKYIKIEFYQREDTCRFDRAGVFYDTAVLKAGIAYVIRAEEWNKELCDVEGCGFIIVGKIPLKDVPEHVSSIQVLDACSEFMVLDIIQETFTLFEQWNQKLHIALNSEKPLDLIIEASEKIFRNPMFIHDNYFYVLAYSEQLKNLNVWETDLKTGFPVVRSGIRDDFQLDQEYLEGLSERKTVLFSANQRGYQILYRNLYSDQRYVGRVLVDEVMNVIQPGDYEVMEYLADFIQETMKLKALSRGSVDGQMDAEIRQVLMGQQRDNQAILRMISQRGWSQDDLYRCMKLVPNQTESYLVSNTAVVDRLHVLLPNCYTLLYEDSAVVIVNMTRSDKTIKEIVTGLAVFLRDSLMKLGISSEYRGFFRLQSGYKQAVIALEQGQRSNSMYWYQYFENYMVEYVRETMSAEMPVEMLVSGALNILKKYDADNHTELYNTLKVYLRLERNLLQTAKKLFVHRSTLSYRIERIQSIAGINLDDEKERLILLLSFALEE